MPDLRHARARLVPLVQSGFTGPALEIAAPRTALLRTLRGVLTVTAPDGTVTARLPFSSRQLLTGYAAAPVVPPGWWTWLSPVDPDGSAALRALGAGQADALLDAALTGPRAAAGALTALLPELTSADLRAAVGETACAAAECARSAATLRALREDRPPP
ncbi:hypothetical protein [Actinomadura sp. 21ATH]|uniref:hypothetical protein n=1 Tax=Actinomadura sp. 21ATH TaxID=1735444 RepID=UPI0035C19FB0